ncbi:MAG: acyltransferase [Aquabacterium sp.]|nr:acyltransferase [Aquabacterium sp.]
MPKLSFLDALRAGLALWVFWGHLAVMCAFDVPVLSAPGAAVDGFMIISGFLMVYTTQRTLGQSITVSAVRDFYLTRLFRIAPLYYVMLLLCGLCVAQWTAMRDAWWSASHGAAAAPLEAMIGLATLEGIVAHATFVFGLFPSWVMSVPLPDWSLSLEMQFYVLYPLLCAMGYWLRWRMVWLVVVTTLCALVLPLYLGYFVTPGLWMHYVQPSLLVLKLNVFLSGMLLAHWYLQHAGKGIQDKFSLGMAVLCLASVKPIVWVFFLLFWYLLSRPYGRLSSMLSIPLFSRLGDWSYGIYLIHTFLMVPVLWGMDQVWHISQWSPLMRYVVSVGVCSATVLIMAALFHRLIEKPGIQLGRHLLAKD